MLFIPHAPYRRFLTYLFILSLIGAGFVILSPGNFAREAHPAFADWYNQGFFTRLVTHVIRNISYIFQSFFVLCILYVFLIIIKRKQLLSAGNKDRFWMLFFGLFSLFAATVLFGGPPSATESIFDQYVFYVDVSGFLSESAGY